MPGRLGTLNGYSLFEVTSWMQKAIRRGRIEDACWCAVELDISSYGEYCWRRLRIIASEDVGMANPSAAPMVDALYNGWKDFASRDQDADRLFLIHAVFGLCLSPKSRVVDNLTIVAYTDHGTPEVPDWAYDMHTQKGRAMGRGVDHFYEEGAATFPAPYHNGHPVLADVLAGKDPWLEQARAYREQGVKAVAKVPRTRSERQARLSEAVAGEKGGEQ